MFPAQVRQTDIDIRKSSPAFDGLNAVCQRHLDVHLLEEHSGRHERSENDADEPFEEAFLIKNRVARDDEGV